jgi:hypothetical protein
MTAAARAVTAVTAVTPMASMVGKRDFMILPESLKKRSPVTAIIRTRRCPENIGSKYIPRAKPCGKERRDNKGSAHNALTFIASVGCHSKKPEHASRSLQGAHSSEYLRFQSDIEAGAR